MRIDEKIAQERDFFRSSLRGAKKGVGEIGYFPVEENSAVSVANGHVRNRGFLRSELASDDVAIYVFPSGNFQI